MNQKTLLRLSLVLNLVFILTGSIYLIRKLELKEAEHFRAQRANDAVPAARGDFISTLDWGWQAQLYEREPVQNGAVIFLGDSITEGGHWDQVWRGRALKPILNRGLAGDTIEGVIARIGEVVRHHPSKIFVMIGINDLRSQRTTPDDLVRQYKAFIQELSERSPESQIYVESLLPTSDWTNDEVKEVNRQLSEVAAGGRVRYVDIHSLMTDEKGELKKAWTFDGVHIRAAAYQKWQEYVWPSVDG
ncbi:MAG: GDSL-type esterase/lipase family protein [Blastocatellia bacterium]